MFQRFLLRLYYKIYRYDHWRRYHFSFNGHLILLVMSMAIVFGIDTKQSTTYQLAAFLFALILLAFINSLFNRLNVSSHRQLPRYATVGERFSYNIILKNLTPNTYDQLILIERLHVSAPLLSQLHTFYQSKHQPFFKRFIGFKKWYQFLNYQRGGILDETPLPPLSQRPLSVKIHLTPTRRGKLTLDNSYLAKTDRLGLYRRLILLNNSQSLLILPQRYPINPLNLSGQRKYQQGGVSLANSVGDSSEFMSLRDYQQGDPLNTIHWKSYAKQGKLIVKEYQDEYFVRRALLLDTFVGSQPNDQFEAAVSVAASIAMSERQNEALLDLMFVGHQAYCFTTGRGVDHLPHLQEILAAVQTSSETAFEKLQQHVFSQLGQCSSFFCVLMHWDNARQSFVKQLLARNIPVAVFLIHGGELILEQCNNKPEHFYLINYHHLATELAKI
ncbi:MAG: DUF58 domain-containing protein [Methylococcales bacterium]|nr:DUF58 domain-containing protein [Methylococcales bacterium]